MLRIAGVMFTIILAAPAKAPASSPPTDRHGDPLPAGAIARMGTARFHFGGYARSLRFSPDGKVLALAGGRRPLFFAIPSGKRLNLIAAGTRSIDD